jgi:hypothetical protein
MLGVGSTVNVTPLLATPPTVTTTGPVVAPLGTGTTIEVALQLVGVALVPLKVTALVPWVEPKFVPVMVTAVPTAPDVGEMLRVEFTVKVTPLLATPLALTATFPLLAPPGTVATIVPEPQLVIVPEIPLKVTVPCVVLKLFP